MFGLLLNKKNPEAEKNIFLEELFLIYLKIFIIFQCLKWYIKLSEQELVEKFFSLCIIGVQGFKSIPLHTFSSFSRRKLSWN